MNQTKSLVVTATQFGVEVTLRFEAEVSSGLAGGFGGKRVRWLGGAATEDLPIWQAPGRLLAQDDASRRMVINDDFFRGTSGTYSGAERALLTGIGTAAVAPWPFRRVWFGVRAGGDFASEDFVAWVARWSRIWSWAFHFLMCVGSRGENVKMEDGPDRIGGDARLTDARERKDGAFKKKAETPRRRGLEECASLSLWFGLEISQPGLDSDDWCLKAGPVWGQTPPSTPRPVRSATWPTASRDKKRHSNSPP